MFKSVTSLLLKLSQCGNEKREEKEEREEQGKEQERNKAKNKRVQGNGMQELSASLTAKSAQLAFQYNLPVNTTCLSIQLACQ